MTVTAQIDRILPSWDNPRRELADISDIVQTIRSVGLLEPIIVTEEENGYRVISGHRRLAAAKEAGLLDVPIRVVELEDGIQRIAAMIIANTCRADLDPVDEGKAYQRLIDAHGITQRKLALIVGKSQAHISKRIALLDLPAADQEAISSGSLPVTRSPQARRRYDSRSGAPLESSRVPVIDAASILRRLALREGQGLYLRPAECDVLEALIKQAAQALRAAA